MSFRLEQTEGFALNEIKRQFAPFETQMDKLPFCRIRFFDRTPDVLARGTRLAKLGEHTFYTTNRGIMVGNSTCFAEIVDNFTGIDVYLPQDGKVPQRQLSFLILQAYRYILCNAGQFQMHGAVVNCQGKAIAFCGIPGAGKSTQAHLWEQYRDAKALNLDQPAILFQEDTVLASGSPWSGKEDCYLPDTAPLAAVFFVEQAPENQVIPMTPGEAFAHLLPNNYLYPITAQYGAMHQAAALRVVRNVPFFRLRCTISPEAVEVAYRAVFQEK